MGARRNRGLGADPEFKALAPNTAVFRVASDSGAISKFVGMRLSGLEAFVWTAPEF